MRPEPFEIERYFARFEFSARHLLSSSDCEPLSLAELLEMADPDSLEMWDRLSLAYTESAGLPALREEIARLYDDVAADEVLEVVPEEGILLATTLVVANFPHNPTGELVSREEFAEIAGVVAEAGAHLFSDEMYRLLEQDPADRLPSAVTYGDHAIALSGMSKTFSLPGLRVGWLVTHDEALRDRIACLKDYTTICASAPSEVLALAGLRARESIVARNLRIVRTNLDAIDEFVGASDGAFRWTRPKAGSVGLARWDTSEGTSAVCERLGADGIMLLPSRVFGHCDQHVRFGFGRASFAESLGALAEWIARDAAAGRHR